MLNIETIALLKEVAKINIKSSVGQDVFVIEECSELIKALTKLRRKDTTAGHLDVIEEACDVLTTVLTLLIQNDYGLDAIENQIKYKATRAIARYKEDGSV